MRTVRPEGVVCIGGLPMGVCLPRGGVDRILNTRLWKHYLSATSFADGKNYTEKIVTYAFCGSR